MGYVLENTQNGAPRHIFIGFCINKGRYFFKFKYSVLTKSNTIASQVKSESWEDTALCHPCEQL